MLYAAAAVGPLGLAAAGATAFTNTTTFTNPNTTVGYGSESVSGAVVSSIQYGLSADGSTIDSVTFVADGDTSGSAASIGFTTISSQGTAQPTTPCDTGTFSSGSTTYVCNDNGAGLDQPVADIEATNIAVS
jgi:hypothetical protein